MSIRAAGRWFCNEVRTGQQSSGRVALSILLSNQQSRDGSALLMELHNALETHNIQIDYAIFCTDDVWADSVCPSRSHAPSSAFEAQGRRALDLPRTEYGRWTYELGDVSYGYPDGRDILSEIAPCKCSQWTRSTMLRRMGFNATHSRITVLKADGSTIWVVLFRSTTHPDCAALRHYFHSPHSTHLCLKLYHNHSIKWGEHGKTYKVSPVEK
jgi:hypothetical protein